MKRAMEKKFNPLFAMMVAFMLGYFLVNDLSLRYIYVYALLGFVLLVSIFYDGIIRPGMKLKNMFLGVLQCITPVKACFLFMAFVIAVYTVLPNSDRDYEVIATTISMLVLSVYLLFIKTSEKAVKRGFAAIHVVSVIFSIYIIVVAIHPEFYWQNIYPYLGSYTQERAMFLMPLGYGVPIGGSTSYGVYVITIAFFHNLGKMLLNGGIRKPYNILSTVISTILYLTAILLVNRRSEVLALLGAAVVLFVVYLILQGKDEWKIKALSLGSTTVLILLVVFLLTRAGYLERYMVMLESIRPDTSQTTVVTTTPPDSVGGENQTPGEEGTTPSDPEVQETAPPTVVPPEVSVPKTELSHGRFELWKHGIELFLEKPIFGIGWMQFRQNSSSGEDYVHNTYIQWLCETGVVGFLMIITPIMLMLFMTFKQTLRFIKVRNTVPSDLPLINFVALAMHGYFLALNLIDPTFYHLYFFIFYSFVITLADTALRLGSADYLGGDKKCLIKRIWESAKLF